MTRIAMEPTTKSSTSTPLRDAAAALQAAESGLDSGDSAATHKALVMLARMSYESLSAFEQAAMTEPGSGKRLSERLSWWRQQLDEARVQLALAEMDTRAAREEVLDLVEHKLEPLADVVGVAISEISNALAAVRKELQPHLADHAADR